jgi:hypothetical protein
MLLTWVRAGPTTEPSGQSVADPEPGGPSLSLHGSQQARVGTERSTQSCRYVNLGRSKAHNSLTAIELERVIQFVIQICTDICRHPEQMSVCNKKIPYVTGPRGIVTGKVGKEKSLMTRKVATRFSTT